jgi:RNA polymerase sigma-70 factor, ECF subfamily
MSRSTQPDSLWREHRARLYRFVLGRVGDAAAAEDIVQDVLVRAYERGDTLRDGGKLEQWLYQITRHAIIDHYRARRPSAPLPDDLPEAETPDGRAARTELAGCIQPFIRNLPEHYRAAIDLSDIRGLTQQATADALGLSLSGAKSRVQRARRMLADMILDCCRIERDSTGAIMSYEGSRCASDGGASSSLSHDSDGDGVSPPMNSCAPPVTQPTRRAAGY